MTASSSTRSTSSGPSSSCTRRVEVRELADLSTPATIGWRRPLLLLPGDWREWSVDERRAVLAHELAHVCRGDFLAGLLAQLALAIHFYHPLAHWLAARLRLEQELAADAWGARLSGGKPSYLATLARMALRRDGRAMTWPVRAFLPSHGTFVRRIEMLRNAKHIRPESPPIAARILTFVALGALGLLVAGLRGPVGESSVLAQVQPTARAEGADTPASPETYNLAFLPADTKMVLAIRPGSLIRRPEIRSLVDAMTRGTMLGQGLLVAPGDVEQAMLFWEGESPDPIQTGRSTLVPPPSAMVLRTTRAQDWKALLGKLFGADSREARHDGQTYAHMFANGPPGWGFYMPDDRTLVAAREVLLRELIEDRNAPPSSHVWDDAWKKVSKGQVVLALETRWLRRRIAEGMVGGPSAPGQPSAGMSGIETFSPLLEKAKSYAISIGASDRILSLDLVARAGSEPDAKPVVETLQALLTLGKNAANGMRRDLDRKPAPGVNAKEWALRAAGSLLEKAQVESSEGFVRLHAESPVDLAEGIRLLGPTIVSAGRIHAGRSA